MKQKKPKRRFRKPWTGSKTPILFNVPAAAAALMQVSDRSRMRPKPGLPDGRLLQYNLTLLAVIPAYMHLV
jgi:hypothetical protein